MRGRYIFISILFLIRGVTKVIGFMQNRIALPEEDVFPAIIGCLIPFILAGVSLYFEIWCRKQKKI